jgi:uncharacterized damage-inducible protein DinB
MWVSASGARDLLLYMLWADRATLAALREVSQEDLVRDAGISFHSMLGTMDHMLGAQVIWLNRFLGTSLDHVPSIDDYPDLPSWIHGWEENASHIEAFMAGLTDEQMTAPMTWTTTSGDTHSRPLWQPIVHLVNHTSYHRGQVVSLLRQMGYKAPKTDLIYYFIDRANG